MKKIEFNRNVYKSYKDFYHDVVIKLDKDRFIDWREGYVDLCYNADLLNEFLWYCHKDGVHYIFKNFDKEKISLEKTYDDFEYNIIIRIFERFGKEYQNNKVEFIIDKK